MHRILGIDPGLTFTGWGFVEVKGSAIKFIDCGFIRSKAQESLSSRLHHIHCELYKVINEFKPSAVSLEETFVNKDPKGALKLGCARGIALMTPVLFGLQVFEYTPNTIKKTVAGSGHASKTQVEAMLKFIMPDMKKMRSDSTDALSIALCHIFQHKLS